MATATEVRQNIPRSIGRIIVDFDSIRNEYLLEDIKKSLIVKVVVSKNIYFLFLQVIKYCSVPDVSINKLSTFIGNHVRHRILPDHHHFE